MRKTIRQIRSYPRQRKVQVYAAIALAAMGLLFGGVVIGRQVARNTDNVDEVCRQLNEFKQPFYEQARVQIVLYRRIQQDKPVPASAPGVDYYSKHPEELAAVLRQQEQSIANLKPKDC